MLPVLLHGAGNWTLLPNSLLHKIQVVYMRWVRTIVSNGCWTDDQLPDDQIQMVWRMPSVATRLAKLRLLFAFHLFVDAPPAVVELVTAVASFPHSWMSALRQALTWALTVDPSFASPDLPHDSLEHLVQWFVLHREDGPRWVRRVYKRSQQHGAVIGDMWIGHYRLFHQLRHRGCSLEEMDSTPLPDQPCQCRWCPKSFATPRLLQNHLWSAHGEASEERQFIVSTICPACHHCFWTVNRLQIHLRQSRQHADGCFARLTWTQSICLDPAPVSDLGRDERHQRLPAFLVPHVDSFAATTCHSPDEADRLWSQACQVENVQDGFLAHEIQC